MNRKKTTSQIYEIELRGVDQDALDVLEKLHNSGYEAYLVGGGVRDLLLGTEPMDFDISTSAKPEEVKQLFRNCILIGRRFRLAHLRFGKKILEVSTFRSGDNEANALIVRDNEWGTSEEDALRRDFTINGLFYDPSNQTIIDYVGGYTDIQNKYLKTIGQPLLRFKQDPVRMIRLIKFQARFGFEIDNQTKEALQECRHEILKSSQARILEELLRMLESGASKPFFRLMHQYGLLELLSPAFATFLHGPCSSHMYSLLSEIDSCMQKAHLEPLQRPVLLNAFIFPLLEERINTLILEQKKAPHLGEIYKEASLIIDQFFQPFFLLPRKIRISMLSILTSQYRLNPLDPKRAKHIRINKDEDFPLALKFLQLRSQIDPSLQKIWERWFDHEQNHPSHVVDRPRRKRRRRPRAE